MKTNSFYTWQRLSNIILTLGVSTCVHATDYGTLDVLEYNALNNNYSVAVTKGTGCNGNWTIGSVNRGDFDLHFNTPNDSLSGTPIICVNQDGRDNSKTSGGTGITYATAAFDVSTSGTNYWAVVPSSPNGNEWNANLAFAYFRFDEWLAARITNNDSTNGPMAILVGSQGINLGTEFVDVSTNNGIYELNLAGLNASSQAGILLTVGYRNEDNFAMARANDDGTFSVYCLDNGGGYENDGVAFAYIPIADVGTKHLIACARVRSGGTTSVAGGDFAITQGNTGIWYLTISGHNRYTGTLIVSAEGGSGWNGDNIVACEWEEATDQWKITSRDLPGMGLQDGSTSSEEIFSFAFFSTGEPPAPFVTITAPTAAATAPVGEALSIAANVRVFGERTITAVEFFANEQSLGVDQEAPYEVLYSGNSTGLVTFAAVAVDSASATGTSSRVSAWFAPTSPTRNAVSVGLFGLPMWTVKQTSSGLHAFSSQSADAGDIILSVNGTYPLFTNGVFLVSSWNESLSDTLGKDNLVSVWQSGTTRVIASVTDNSNNNATNANPSTSEDAAGAAVAYLPFTEGWLGASVVSSSQTIGQLNGVTVYPISTGLYRLDGLPLEGNILAIPINNNNDNQVSVLQYGAQWHVAVIDNNTGLTSEWFTFLYIPTNAVGVYSGRVRGGVGEALNSTLAQRGFTVTTDTDGYTLTIGDGSVINPQTAALFITGDATVGGLSDPAIKDIWSWCADGNAFKVFSQALPVLDGSFDPSNFTFLIVPFNAMSRGTVITIR